MTSLQVTPGAGASVFVLPYIPLGYAQYTSAQLASATSLSTAPNSGISLPAGAMFALISCNRGTAGVSYRDDGTAPTAGLGALLQTTGSPLLYAGTLSAIQFIQQAAGAVLDVLYYK